MGKIHSRNENVPRNYFDEWMGRLTCDVTGDLVYWRLKFYYVQIISENFFALR
ncbi:unnamed protein product [Brassicogethes aeneus]|uniref:Uncharacterized protein n=1 Tax=Brassicogethes aeneus TaxID=1431903 RepID=A0A9P0AP38_BRAAE|nr:unnamed protein product [Brassicogethes aeneus]